LLKKIKYTQKQVARIHIGKPVLQAKTLIPRRSMTS
jgi:hypothetical protein